MLREVGADDVLDVRVLHLDRDLGAVVQRRRVHLRERRGRERRLVEAGETLRQRPAELALDVRLDLVEALAPAPRRGTA